MIIEINGISYISVKGTVKIYGVKTGIISYHIRENPEIFKDHVINQKTLLIKLKVLSTSKEKHAQLKLWLDKFAFLEIGTLLNDSPKTIPIKAWKSKLVIREVEEKLIIVIYIFLIPIDILLSQY